MEAIMYIILTFLGSAIFVYAVNPSHTILAVFLLAVGFYSWTKALK